MSGSWRRTGRTAAQELCQLPLLDLLLLHGTDVARHLLLLVAEGSTGRTWALLQQQLLIRELQLVELAERGESLRRHLGQKCGVQSAILHGVLQELGCRHLWVDKWGRRLSPQLCRGGAVAHSAGWGDIAPPTEQARTLVWEEGGAIEGSILGQRVSRPKLAEVNTAAFSAIRFPVE